MIVDVITLKFMTSPIPMQQERSITNRPSTVTLGLVLLLVSAVLALWLLRLLFLPVVGDNGMRIAALGVIFLAVSPLTAAVGLYLIYKYSERIAHRFIGWATAMPTIIACLILVTTVVLDMRPVPKYSPRDYQHLVGQSLSDAEAELGKRKSLSGYMSEGGVSYRFISYRGIEIIATTDGVITEVRQGHMD